MATIKLDLQPFSIPNVVYATSTPGLKQGGFVQNQSFQLYQLDIEVLTDMCNDFTVAVLKLAQEQANEQARRRPQNKSNRT